MALKFLPTTFYAQDFFDYHFRLVTVKVTRLCQSLDKIIVLFIYKTVETL